MQQYNSKYIEMKFNNHTDKHIRESLNLSVRGFQKIIKYYENVEFEYLDLSTGEMITRKEIIPYVVQIYNYIKICEEEVKQKRFLAMSPFKISFDTLERHHKKLKKDNLHNLVSLDFILLLDWYFEKYLNLTDVGLNKEGFLTSKDLYYVNLRTLGVKKYKDEKGDIKISSNKYTIEQLKILQSYIVLFDKLKGNFYETKKHILKDINIAQGVEKFSYIFILKIFENLVLYHREYKLPTLEKSLENLLLNDTRLYIKTKDLEVLTKEQMRLILEQKKEELLYIYIDEKYKIINT